MFGALAGAWFVIAAIGVWLGSRDTVMGRSNRLPRRDRKRLREEEVDVAGPRRPTVFCPFCNAKGAHQPVLSPMGVLFVEGGKPATVQPFAAPHFTYVCPRCGFGEIHERLVDTA